MGASTRRGHIRAAALAVVSVALLLALALAAGCGGATSPAPISSPGPSASSAVATSTPTASPSPAPTSAPTVAPLSWGAILGEKLAFGTFVVFVDPAYDANVLVVQENGQAVGFVYVDTHPAAEWTFDVTGPSGLARMATDFMETLRIDRTTSDPAGTFTPMPATEVAVGGSRGFRYGFAWKDHAGNLERVVQYVAAVPGGIAFIQAIAPPSEVGRSAFTDEATLERFLPVLDQIVAGLRWPAA